MWGYFVLGQVLNVMRQAALISGSGKSASIRTVWRFWYRNLLGILVRFAAAGILWAFTVYNSSAVANMLGFGSGLVVPDIWVVWFGAGVFMDLAVDYAIERWPSLKSKIPVLN